MKGRVEALEQRVEPVPQAAGGAGVAGNGVPADDTSTVAEALVELTHLPLGTRDRGAVLATTASICQRALGDEVTVSVHLGQPAEPEHTSNTSKLAQVIDGAQMGTGEGPCEEAWETGQTVRTADVGSDPRWPDLAQRLEQVPATEGVSVPIRVGGDLLGALNVFGRGRPVTAQHLDTIELLASAVSAIIFELDVKAELETTASDLRSALTSRATIDQAKGIIMATERCGPDEAFERLVVLSSRQNSKLRDVAASIVDQTSRPRSPSP